jgi:prepilin-type N-terminal cleavage/methylation domain-containing protein
VSARSGLTLLELVVALTVTAMALAGGYAAFGTIADRREQVERSTDDVVRAAAVRRMLVAWLSGAHLTVDQTGPSFQGLDGVHDHAPDDALTFLTTAATPLGARETVVHLYVARDSAGPERGLVADLTEWPGTGSKRVLLSSAVHGLDIAYISGVLGARQRLPSWISTSVLPAGLVLTLSAAPGDSLPPLLRLPIVLPFRGGQ